MDEIFTKNTPMITAGCSSSSSISNSNSNYSQKQLTSIMENLSNRLQVLEQDIVQMNKVLVVCMDERKEIMGEILQLFRTLCTHYYGAQSEDSLCRFYQEIKCQNTGLLKALSEDSNPFLVLRGSIKANIFCQY